MITHFICYQSQTILIHCFQYRPPHLILPMLWACKPWVRGGVGVPLVGWDGIWGPLVSLYGLGQSSSREPFGIELG